MGAIACRVTTVNFGWTANKGTIFKTYERICVSMFVSMSRRPWISFILLLCIILSKMLAMFHRFFWILSDLLNLIVIFISNSKKRKIWKRIWMENNIPMRILWSNSPLWRNLRRLGHQSSLGQNGMTMLIS